MLRVGITVTAVHMASRTTNYAFVDKNWHESSIVVARCKEVYLVYKGSRLKSADRYGLGSVQT